MTSKRRALHKGIGALIVSCVLALAWAQPAPQETAPTKTARGRNGMVAASTPYATAAGVEILEAGGNAVDAAAAACFALMVTDPAMTSLGGRVQMLLYLRDGGAIGMDGATEQPAGVPPLAGKQDDRIGYRVVPVPGSPATLAHAVKKYGRLSLARVMAPAIRLAEDGFTVTPKIGSIWEEERERLVANPGARENYLKPDGSPYRAGERFRHPRLAGVLKQIAKSGPDALYRGRVAEAIARDVKEHGGYLTAEDLRKYSWQPGTLVRTSYRGYEVLTLGRHAWGNTLVEMLNILGNFSLSRGEPTAEEVELVARVIGQAMQDRPQMLGTLAPKPGGLPLDVISSQEFARERADRIRERMKQERPKQDKQDDSGVPTGLANGSGAVPSDESLGYFRLSLRDTMLPRSAPEGHKKVAQGACPERARQGRTSRRVSPGKIGAQSAFLVAACPERSRRAGRRGVRRGGRSVMHVGTIIDQTASDGHDTTHLSVMDAEGNAVALTTSIGPRFGAGVATPELGFLYAHSYRMRSSPEPGERDYTEMTPTIALRDGKPFLVLGAAGSERIPGAILHVLSNVIDRGMPLDEAVAAPRVFSPDGKRVRVHDDTPAAVIEALRARGFAVELVPRGISRHLGIVQAVMFDAKTGEFAGTADPVYDGSAAAPKQNKSTDEHR